MRTVVAEPMLTPRLALLPLSVEHAGEMATVLADPALYAFIGGEPPSPQSLRARYEHLVAGSPDPAVIWCNWVIQLRDDGSLAGTVQATITVGGGAAEAEVAWVVGTPWQGRGIATEAARALVGWLRQQSIQTVMAHIHPGNQASAAVAAAAGLVRTDRWHEGEVQWRLPTA